MKKTSLFIALLIVTGLSVAQAQTHRLTTDRNAYRPADRIVKQQVEFKDPGSSGKNLTWDFSMLQPINEDYKLNYFIPDSTFMDTICGMEHRTRYYYNQKRDTLWAIGFENSTTMMQYTKPELKLKYPFSYGDTLYSAFNGEGEYCHSFALNVKGYTRTVADAEGELMLPGFETIKKALRVRTLRHYTETGKDSVEMTLDTYAWYAEGIRYPVFESIKTNLIKNKIKEGEQAMDTTVFTTSFFYPPTLQYSQLQIELPENTFENELPEIEKVFTEGSYQPNPVVTDLNINFKLTRQATVWFTLHTNSGIPVCQTPTRTLPEGYNNASINMSNLITGTYTLFVHVDDMVMRQVVVKK